MERCHLDRVVDGPNRTVCHGFTAIVPPLVVDLTDGEGGSRDERLRETEPDFVLYDIRKAPHLGALTKYLYW